MFGIDLGKVPGWLLAVGVFGIAAGFLKGHFTALKDTSVLSHDSIAELCLSRLGDLVAFEVSPGLCLVRLATPTCQRGRREG